MGLFGNFFKFLKITWTSLRLFSFIDNLDKCYRTLNDQDIICSDMRYFDLDKPIEFKIEQLANFLSITIKPHFQ